MFFYDWTIILLLPAVVFAGFAQGKVRSAYRTYSKIGTERGITGVQTARKILDAHGLFDVPIEHVSGELTDHYDPIKKTLRLSEGIYADNSIASVAIAAHECGHALQHQSGYTLLVIRNLIARPVSLISMASWPLLIIGIFMAEAGKYSTGHLLIDIGIIAFCGAVLFHLVTLPVEINASKRGLRELQIEGVIVEEEVHGSKKMLTAAALTYVAALMTSLAQLLRMLILVRRD